MIPVPIRRVLRLNRISVCVSAREWKIRSRPAHFARETKDLISPVRLLEKKCSDIFRETSGKEAKRRKDMLLSLYLFLFLRPIFALPRVLRAIHLLTTVLESGFCSYLPANYANRNVGTGTLR